MSPSRTMFLVALAALGACTSPALEEPEDGALRGELATYVVDRGGGRSELEHRLHDGTGQARTLIFAGTPDLAPGTRLRVWGDPDGEAIRVRRHQVESTPVEALSSALITTQPRSTRKWVFVLVDIDGGGNPINKDNAQQVLFNPDRPDSIRAYFREVSYGVQDLDGTVVGPIPYQMGGRCDTDRLAAALTPQVQGTYDQYLWFFGKQQPACNWAGIAQLGRADRPTRHSWYNSFHSCTVLVQEPGHNFGMVHSSAMKCTVNGQRVPIAWPTQEGADCRHVEYGNPFDPMGGGDCFHMNGVQKAYQDWLGGCNVIKVTESGTFDLYPLESACDGPQLLHIPFPEPRAFSNAGRLTGYYLELRTPTGRDRRLPPQVQVTVANDVREARFTGNPNWLLDMTPETPDKLGDEALPVGRLFEDTMAGGPKFTVVSADATKAVVKVELQGKPAMPGQAGKAVCSDSMPYQPAAPVRCVAPPTPAAPPPMTVPGADGGVKPASDAGAAPDAEAPGGSPDARGGGRPRVDADEGDPGEDPGAPAPRKPASGGCGVGGTPTAAGPLLLLLLALGVGRRSRAR